MATPRRNGKPIMRAKPIVDAAGADPLCWICKANKADSGEHKTKRSDLLAVLGTPSQEKPFFTTFTRRTVRWEAWT